MKYDRPVWQIMYLCAAAMPQPFRYDDVHAWFGQHYPEVNQATIRAHLVGMSEGGREKQVQFAQRAPLFRRVARGTYAVIPEDERVPDPDLDARAAVKLGQADETAQHDEIARDPDAETVDADPTSRRSEPPAPSRRRPDPFAEAAFSEATVVRAPREVSGHAEGTDPAEQPTQAVDAPEAVEAVEAVEREIAEPEVAEHELEGDAIDDELDRMLAGESVRPEPKDDVGPLEGTGRSAPDLAPPAFDPVVADVVLLGSAGERVIVPAPAREIFRDEDFQRSRAACQSADVAWFVLSCEHGLLEPSEWISPDSRSLPDFEPQYRLAWAHWVVARLESLTGSLAGRTVLVDAPASFIGPLSAALQDFEALVSVGTAAEVVAGVPATAVPVETAPALVDPEAPAQAQVVRIDPVTRVSEHLLAPRHIVPASADLDDLPEGPGILAWHVDLPGARVLNRSLRLPVRAGVIFIGSAGATGGVADPHVTGLRRMVAGVHLGGRSRSSTFRTTLATILAGPLNLHSLDDARLTAWMVEHLSVSVWASDDREDLRRLSQLMVEKLDPRLNLDHLPAAAVRRRVSELRAQLG